MRVRVGQASCLPGSTAIEYDNLEVKIDDTTTAMTGTLDDTVVSDDFADTVLTLTQDNNGNLTSDGLYDYVYDAWNRLVEVQYADGDPCSPVPFVTYTYDGLNRRIIKDVNYNAGVGIVHRSDLNEAGAAVLDPAEIQAGAHTEHDYYAGWRVVEERDGSDVVLAQTVWGIEYIDAPVCRDRNTGDPASEPACTDSGDERYFYHQDANFRVVALSNEDGEVVERDYDAYGDVRIYLGHCPRTN